MTILFITAVAACFVSYANGANDNFKGVATLFGSGTTDYNKALGWATLTTFAGSAASLVLAGSLTQRFSGKGLVPDTVAASPNFLLAVALSAGLTVIVATLIGFPISTTHGLTGALVGAGFVAVGIQVNFAALGALFFLPLVVSPVLAVALGYVGYTVAHQLRFRFGISRELCVCIGETQNLIPLSQISSAAAFSSSLSISVDTTANCEERYVGSVIGLDAQTAINVAHYASAGMVSFARGLNDTPKIAALFLATKLLNAPLAIVVIGIAMAIGGWWNARRVAETMSKKITPLNHGQGLTANLVTSLLVIIASQFGLPVSTTHVSVGSLFGIGVITRKANVGVISSIILSWLLTLPIAAVLSGVMYWLLS